MSYKGTAIMGRSTARVEQMEAVTRRVNPSAPALAGLYLSLASGLGVRGDLAYAQALLETNYFRYGGLVRPEQNNYAGIGATGPGEPGAAFATPEEGVLAHLQHLYAYAGTEPLPAGMRLVDPRFDRVPRGSATHIGELNGKWAVPGGDYGQNIDRIFGTILMEPSSAEPYVVTNAFLSTSSKNRPGPCTTSGCWRGVQGIVVHRTASPSMNARAIRNYFNDSPDGRFASSQYVLDDKEILILMPIGEVAYHTAGANFAYLGIETCEHNWGMATWPETYQKLVWLTAYLARSYQLPIAQVKGHFEFDPVNRPYDPTYPGWTPEQGKGKGLFVWSQFLADVQAEINRERPPEQGVTPPPAPGPEPGAPESIPVRVIGGAGCELEGRLIGDQTYVPIRAYTRCVRPDAVVNWVDGEWRVEVTVSGPGLPPVPGPGLPPTPGPGLPPAPGTGAGEVPQAGGGAAAPGGAADTGAANPLAAVRERRLNQNLPHQEFVTRARAVENGGRS